MRACFSALRLANLAICISSSYHGLQGRTVIYLCFMGAWLSSVAFRPLLYKATRDTYLAHEIEDGFQHKKQTLTVWIDLQKAFDTVWTDGLLLKLKKCNIAGNMFGWIKSYLHNRRARVVIDNTKSKKILLRHGVPQGGVISPTLFLVFINDLINKFPSPVKCAMYADDLVLWSIEEYATTAKVRLQEATNILSSWAQDWCVNINKTKSFTTLFTLSTKSKPVTIMLDDTELQHTDSATYLGITFDKRQTWRTHISRAEAKARRKLALLRKLAGTQWGAAENSVEECIYRKNTTTPGVWINNTVISIKISNLHIR